MPTTVHLAPVGTGKTEHALHRLLEFVHDPKQPFLKVWVLLATQRQEAAFRQRLVDLQTTHTVFFNVEFFNFYTLNTRLLNIAGKPQRRIEGSARVSLLRIIINEMLAQNEITFFRDIAHTAGFITVLSDLITELKQNGVEPEQFATSAQTAKDHEIAAIYHQYQQQLIHNNLADLEGIAWQALATLKSTPSIADDVNLLLVDGYDQFTPIQAQLLTELSRTISNVDITLTTVPNQANYAHRFQRALDRLQQTHDTANITLNQQIIQTQSTTRHPDLEQLRQLIFQGTASHPASDAIQLIEMPTPLEEVMAVLRAVKQQLIDGVRPDDIIIIMRDWTHYETFFESYRLLYDLPLLLHRHATYHKTPVISVILDLLELAPDFRRRDVLDILHSPYIDAGLSPDQIELLDALTREKQFVRGTKQAWLDMINFASTTARDDDEDHDRDTNEPLLTMDEADILCHKLALFFDSITPPTYDSVAPYVAWLESLIGQDPNVDPEQDTPDDSPTFSLHIAQQVHTNTTDTDDIKNRDITALNGIKRILQDQLKTDDFVRSTLNADHTTNWQTIWADIKFSLQHTLDAPSNPSRSSRVLVTTANNARGLHHDHVYILGMAEGVFPAEISEDPLYLDSERKRLQADGVFIETQAERTDDQGLFYELISLPRATLTLSRPTVQDGKVWIESHLWRAVRMVYPELTVDAMVVGQVVHPSRAASRNELLLAVANQLNQADASHPDVEQSLSIQNWLKHDHSLRAMWSRILRGRTADSKRLSSEPYDNYSGYLLHPKLQDAAAELLGTDHIWSASQLKDYGLCGFRYYAKRLLKLEAINDPEEGYDILQLGLINHSILEDTYTELRNNKTDITPDNLDDALTILRQHAQRILAQAPQEFNFRESVVWEQEKSVILQRLEALVKLDFSGESPLNTFGEQRRIYQLERYFQDVEIPLTDDIGALKIRGFIDRIDRIDGNKLVVLDYKTGTTKINTSEMSDGRDFQMMTYILALQHILQTTDTNLELAGGMFWHLRNLEASGIFKADNADDQQAMQSARQHIANNLRNGRAGKFPVHANHIEDGKCSRYCDYSHLCRMSITNRYKPES